MKFLFLPLILLVFLGFMVFDEEMQSGMIFFPTKLDKNFRYDNGEEVFLSTPDQENINGLYFSKGKKVILYLHGNAGDLGGWQYVAEELAFTGTSLFIIDYRGYGKSSGKPGEKGFYIDAQTAYDYLIDEKNFTPQEIIIYGRSIGSGVATELASKNQHAALILESPFSSLLDLAKHLYPWLFPQLFLKYHFDNISKINHVHSPVLILHGNNDEVVPFESGKKLFDAIKGPKTFVAIDGGTHNNLSQFDEFRDGIVTFLGRGDMQ